jgi:hypothetical protein
MRRPNRPVPRTVRNAHFAAALAYRSTTTEAIVGRGLLLWLIGIPLPIILVVWLLGGLH